MILDAYSSAPLPDMLDEQKQNLMYFFLNPSSSNMMSMRSKEILVRSRRSVAQFLGCSDSEVIFTSSSTESNNLAIKGVLFNSLLNTRKGNIVTTDWEHISIHHPIKSMQRLFGFGVVYIKTDSRGEFDVEDLRNVINEDTLLFTIGAVCRETATIRDVASIVRKVKSINPNVICHVDLWGLYYPTDYIPIGEIDIATLDGPFLLAPQGISALYVKKGVRLRPLIEGGIQERGIRAGEGNLFGIFSLGYSLKFLTDNKNAIVLSLKEADNLLTEYIHLPALYNPNRKALGLFSYGIKTDAEMFVSLLEKHGFLLGTSSPCMLNDSKKDNKGKNRGFSGYSVYKDTTFNTTQLP